jgi:hypothetical protein
MLLCHSGMFLPSLSISGESIDYKGVTIHRPSVILCVNRTNFLACVRIELESWSLIGQSICDVRQQTRLYGLWIGKWPIAYHPWSVLACEVGPVSKCSVAVDVGVVEPGKFSLNVFFVAIINVTNCYVVCMTLYVSWHSPILILSYSQIIRCFE